MPIQDGINLDIDIVLGHDDLLRDIGNLDLDVDLCQLLRDGVNLCQTRVNNLVEFAETGDETHGALGDGLVRVRAADAAGNGSEGTKDVSRGIHQASVDAVVLIVRGELYG
jgi:hypothetical protein